MSSEHSVLIPSTTTEIKIDSADNNHNIKNVYISWDDQVRQFFLV